MHEEAPLHPDAERKTERELIATLMLRIEVIEAVLVETMGDQCAKMTPTEARAGLDRITEHVDLWRVDGAEGIELRRNVRMATATLLQRVQDRGNVIRDLHSGASTRPRLGHS